MKDSINIYWSTAVNISNPTDLLHIPPKLVMSDIKDYIKKELGVENYFQCPAFSDYYKNMFAVKSPIDFNIRINPITLLPFDKNPPDPHTPYMLRRSANLNGKVYDIDIQYYFYAEEPIEISQITANLHYNDFTNNTKLFSGKFNIGKWFRPLLPSILLLKPNIKVNRGDTLYYVKFDTDKKINFKHFIGNSTINSIALNCGNLKKARPGYRFADIYHLFSQIGYHKKLLKEIKKSLTDLK